MLAQCLQVNYSLVQIPALMEKNGLPKSSLYFTPVQIQASCYLLLSYSPTPLSLLSVRGLSAKNHNNPYGVLSAVPTLFATMFCRDSALITAPTAGAQGEGGRQKQGHYSEIFLNGTIQTDRSATAIALPQL